MTLHDSLGSMKSLRQWFVWNLRWNPSENKYDKWPECGDASQPAAWLSYDEVLDAVDARPRGTAALGFWMQEADGYFFLDIDKALGSDGWSPLSQQLVAMFPGALVEASSSGRGLHVIGRCKGLVPPHRSRGAEHLEFYTNARGIAFGLSGDAHGSADTNHDEAVRSLIAARFPPIERKESTGPDPSWKGPDDDDALIAKMMSARQSAEAAFGGKPSFKSLWEGTAEQNSENDMALMSHLAFWTGNDWERMVRLARRSGMVRDKWSHHRTYLVDTARKAANSANVYAEREVTLPPAPLAQSATVRSAAALMSHTFKPVQWALRGLLPEGVSILSGDPKTGKSWLVWQACIAIATGKPLWNGRLPEERGEALYLDLEGTDRRLKRRLDALLKGFGGGTPDLTLLHYATEWPRAEAGVAKIAEWLRQNPNARLVVIDTISAFRDNDPGRKSAYAHDYAVGEMLKPLAREFSCAIVLVMHNRKAQAGDFMQKVSGTQGMTGSVDNVLSLERARGNLDGALSVDGRDIEEPLQLALRSNNGFWSCAGNLADVQRSTERNSVIEAVTRLRGSGTAKQIFETMGGEIAMPALRMRLSRMVKAGELQNADGLYVLPASTLPPARP